MGRRSKERRKVAKMLSTVPGGLVGAMSRNRNGNATVQDIDFLARARREMQGRNGYTGESHMPTLFDKGKGKDNFTFHTQSPKAEDGVFHCAESNELTTSCPLNPKVPSILIEAPMWHCFMNLCKEYNTEWIALLIGKLDKDETGAPAYIISRFYFPPQVASGAHVEVPTGVRPRPGTIGAIHSHVDMGVFWSSTDREHSNWPVEIVINRKENYEALSRYQLKCGEWAKTKATVYLTGSMLSSAVKTQMDRAFEDGTRLQAANRAAGSLVNVHPEDRDEAASSGSSSKDSSKAIVKGTLVTPQCNHFYDAGGNPAISLRCQLDDGHVGMHQTVGGMRWLAFPDADTEEMCGYTLGARVCIREKGHAGWHKSAPIPEEKDDYFQGMPDAPVAATSETTPSNATPASNGDDPEPEVTSIIWPPKEPSLTLASIEDDPTIPSNMKPEEFCQTCEGVGYVEAPEDGPRAIKECPDCKSHPGLSDVGAVRAVEDGLIN